MITFEKFFDLIEKKRLSQNELIRRGIINARLLNALKNNRSITLDSLDKLCDRLGCTPDEIITYTYVPSGQSQDLHRDDSHN